MQSNKENNSFDEIRRFFGSVGLAFPRSQQELEVFNKLYSNYKFKISSELVNPDQIYNGNFEKSTIIKSSPSTKRSISLNKTVESWRMAARNNESKLPKDILERMKKNHEKKSKGGYSSQEKND
ncbi:MAG: hypothetical protein WED10_00075 [Brumimicrobium sp.]